MNIKIRTLVAALALFGFSSGAWATVLVMDSFAKFNGGGTSTPVFTATFDDGGSAGTVTLTMDYVSDTSATKIKEWYFNIDDTLSGFGCGNIVNSSGQDGTCEYSKNSLQADGDGKYDFMFTFPTSGDTFDEGDMSVWDITYSGLTAEDFLYLSAPAGGAGPYFSAVQQSAWWAPSELTCDDGDCGVVVPPVEPVPEPGSLALMSLGLAGLVFTRRKMKA